MLSGRAVLALACAATACRAPRAGLAASDCAAPASATLAADAPSDGLVGSFDLTVVALTGPRAGGRATGTLALMRADTLHYGSADIDLAPVGAVGSGTLATADPAAPGVRVFAVPGNVMLRLGADANNPREIRFEGSYTVLRVRQLDTTGMRGEWASGAVQEVATGYFCATRAPTP
jgi:hypothetical protein